MEEYAQGPLLSELETILPNEFAARVKRFGMERGGIALTSTGQMIAELAANWTTPEGGQLVQVVMAALQA